MREGALAIEDRWELVKRIEEYRWQMVGLASSIGRQHSEVLRLSQQLDELINIYYQL